MVLGFGTMRSLPEYDAHFCTPLDRDQQHVSHSGNKGLLSIADLGKMTCPGKWCRCRPADSFTALSLQIHCETMRSGRSWKEFRLYSLSSLSYCCRGGLVVRISTFGKHLGADRKYGSEDLFLLGCQQSGV